LTPRPSLYYSLILSSFERRRRTIEAVAELHRRLLERLRCRDRRVALRAVIDHYIAPEEDRDGRRATLEQIVEAMVLRDASRAPDFGARRREE